MKSSIGSNNPEDTADTDHNGVPDRAEKAFAEDGRPASEPAPADTRAPRPAHDQDDGGLESARPTRGAVRPPHSN